MKHFKCSNIDIITSQLDQETLMLSPDKAYGHPDVYYQDGHNNGNHTVTFSCNCGI